MEEDGHAVEIRSDGRHTKIMVDEIDFSDAFSFCLEHDAESKYPFPRMTITFPVSILEGVQCDMPIFPDMTSGGGD